MSQSSQAVTPNTIPSAIESQAHETVEVVRHIAHEIRQPLSAIEAIAYYLDIVLPRTENKARRQLGKLQQQVHQINWILADALHFLQACPPRLELLDLAEIVSNQVAELTLAERFEVRLNQADNLPLVHLDLEQMQHLLRNLFAFFRLISKSDHPITVSTSATQHEVLLEIGSTEAGHSVDELKSLFEPFSPHLPGGSGLALASARRIAEAHGARIGLQSDPSSGILLTVAFPLAA